MSSKYPLLPPYKIIFEKHLRAGRYRIRSIFKKFIIEIKSKINKCNSYSYPHNKIYNHLLIW